MKSKTSNLFAEPVTPVKETEHKNGRKRRCHECKIEIKPGDSWERHSHGKGRYLYCGNCAERIRHEQHETERYEGRYYP